MPVSVGIMADTYNAPQGFPITFPGIYGWWDGTWDPGFIYSNGTDPSNPQQLYVSYWADLSGRGNHANGNANAAYHPRRNVTINGLKALDFSLGGYNPVGKGLALPTILGPAMKPMTGYIVVRMGSSIVNNGVIFGSRGQAFTLRTFSSGAVDLVIPGQVDIVSSAAGTVVANGLYLIDWSWDAADGTTTIYVNGVSVVTPTVATNTPNPSATYGLGSSDGTNNVCFAGQIGEAAVCNIVSAAADRQAMRNYLKARWGTP